MRGAISGFLLETHSWNSEKRRERSAKRTVKPLALSLLVLVTLIIFYLFFVWSRVWVINLGYQISEAYNEQQELRELNTNLTIERATWISPKQIRSEASKKLKMRQPRADQLRYVK